MNAEGLFRAIGDAPDHISGLRKLAVAFAIGGVFDGDDDQSIESLFHHLEETKATLRGQGKLPKKKTSLAVLKEHLPDAFGDPERFVPLGEVAKIEKGKTGIKQAKPGDYPLVVTAAARETCDHYDFDAAAAIIPLVSSTGHGNASINRLHYQDGQFALGTILVAVLPHDPTLTSARFLFEYLSAFKEELLVSRMTGTANVTLTIGRIAEVPVPLLTARAQSKVDELMGLCDRLEAARAAREEVRDKLTAASLARLTAPDVGSTDIPDQVTEASGATGTTPTAIAFQTHARFALDTLSALTSRPDQIKTLRQTILNLAVRGKLVEQDSADDRNNQSSLRPDKEAENYDQRSFAERAESFDLPSNWTIEPLSRVAGRIVDCPHTTPKWTEKGVLCIKTNQVRAGILDLSAPTYVSEETYQIRIERLEPKAEDILYIREGGVLGVGCRIPPNTRLCMGQRLMLIRTNNSIAPIFLELCLNSPWIADFAAKKTTGGAAPRVNMSLVRGYPIPLPPLAEQHRIVAKVDALMALCSRLEAALTTADTTRTRLLNALLHEALTPATPIPEAAE
ncbi:restriction endonuclease subunit S [Thalassococcus lentus]|uniref:Restriction endonuclease subunit S n=1 Tax=Thalassococcus lentus TaxID=1210524 RepID=A0ABT4XW81_9RHOB|nr:restriction endonuclease subunit S [Thalassococcus lentus]MDA7426212.1 restriction endonuclease subunit S [Thalassococcus lentus]